ncbi:alpha-ketoglutaric semialdehyde dehydrogenase [Cytobacillus horneckiae]|uniref:Aldehyde dehydrogenase family protein n=1 Tax=Cytobacillus horneckiae TaxID=549687 RepID=A0A2N0ZFM9_9BACI|nr:alpha-ketoglutaric semialdehyde dehydrogenase GucD [Cytobacillus horneckiae]MBN6885134.1 aldehyde dehydrogenase family protein [Cytobacillus horneckiae]MEC1154334.1 aldehyde dehydrogenase family protein [Cytobacillus horneckiae]MED2937670.1 aldehyde dehydrogenase family protein [Cytobacillus horneckiae]PKG28320.1 aldehyde dehydrogenase family protein [Cytobacillus horneckiae]
MVTSADVKTILNFVDGSWEGSKSSEVEESINPANFNEIVAYVQNSSKEDLDKAVESAARAQKQWKKLSGAERGSYLFKVADILEMRMDEIAEMMTREMGKTLPEAKGETARGVAILRYYAGEGMRKVGDVIPSSDPSAFMFTTRSPLGVIGVITPWNFPVAIPIWKIAPALIYGNTVVFKPATEAAATAAKIIECFYEAKIPNGVINFVTGQGSVIGQGIADHPNIQGITFTGSDVVGKAVGQAALARGTKYQLEMGGKNPVIVAEDADLDLAVEATISGGLRSTGQKCTATSRVIVHRNVYEAFKDKLVSKVKQIKVGNGLDAGVWMGPSVSERQLNTVLRYIEKGKQEGAKLLFGGNRLSDEGRENGYFIEPTIFDEVDNHMTVAQEEIFGPVLALIKVDSMEAAVNIANDVKFGLSASIFTANIQKMLNFIENIEAGLVRINAESAGVELQAPFGGMKQSSSHSREQGQAAIEFYTAIKTVFVKGS